MDRTASWKELAVRVENRAGPGKARAMLDVFERAMSWLMRNPFVVAVVLLGLVVL